MLLLLLALLPITAFAETPWARAELNQGFMRTLDRNECVAKTIASIKASRCADDSCLKNYGGIVGDCVAWANGNPSEFCAGYDDRYLKRYCSVAKYDPALCGFVRGGKAAFIQVGFCSR